MGISNPKYTANIIPAKSVVGNADHKVLFVAQKLPAGSATAGALITNIGNSGEENTLFGQNSMLAGMIRAARRYNLVTRFDAIALDDAGAAVAATGTVAFTGTATATGTINVVVGSEKNHKFAVPVASGDTATVVGDALEALVNADANIPVTASNSTGTVTLTFDHGGLEGNTTSLAYDGTVAGITTALTAFASGVTNPTLTSVLDVVGEERYHTIVFPSTYDETVFEDFLNSRFNADTRIQDGVALTAFTDTLANLKTKGNTKNSQSLVILGNIDVDRDDKKGSGILEFDYSIASQVASLRSLKLTEGAIVSEFFLSTNGALDSVGGPKLAAKPYHNSLAKDLVPPPVGDEFTLTERRELNEAGISVLGANVPRNNVILDTIVTTYLTDIAGNPDPTFKFLSVVDTVSNFREFVISNLVKQYASTILTEGSVIANRDMANGKIIGAFLDQLYRTASSEEYTWVQAGKEAEIFFKDNRTIALDLEEGKVTITMQVPFVTALRQFVLTIQVSFSVQNTLI